MLVYLLFVLGFFILIKGASLLVDGASAIADKFKISPLVIGLTIVAFGTSAPELLVNILASIKGNSGIVVGNILGSNIANILLILGVSSIIYPLAIKRGTVYIQIPFALLSIIAMGLVANDVLIDGGLENFITRIDGILLLLFFAIFIYYSFSIARVKGQSEKIEEYSLAKSIMFLVFGMIGLGIGGELVVRNAVSVATFFKVSESLIALTIVSIGTSLPELATSVIAALHKKPDIAVGNVIGSNIFNTFWVLGFSAIIRPVSFIPMLNFDILFLVFITILLFVYMFVGKRNVIQKWQGASLTFLYFVYIIYLVMRG